MAKNPIIPADFPDPDVIRVGDTYYMASTTMFLMPGGDILKSKDLVHWEIASHVFDSLGDDDQYTLKNGKHAYARGMWAPTFRYHEGTFYLSFSCNERKNSLLFTADKIEGPWKMQEMGDFFYDSSLFFDDDGRVYIVHGNTIVKITELDTKTWGAKEGGLSRILIQDEPGQPLGFEGSHLYKYQGRYYLFTCHMPKETQGRKTECCFISDALEGEFKGKTVLNDAMGYRPALQVAQGGMVDDPDGNLYMFMFQDRGAIGRAPVIFPMTFDDEGYPMPKTDDGKVPILFGGTGNAIGIVKGNEAEDEYACGRDKFFGDEDFSQASVKELLDKKLWWQISHNPDWDNISIEDGNKLRITVGKTTDNLLQARNTLTQRCPGDICTGEITLDASGLKNGDFAGICAYSAHYGGICLGREDDKIFIAKIEADAESESVMGDKDFFERKPVITKICDLGETDYKSADGKETIRLRVTTDFRNDPDKCSYEYRNGDSWVKVSGEHLMYFKLDLFIGCRFGLFAYGTKNTGGYADFSDFKIVVK